MNFKKALTNFGIGFGITFIVSGVVTFFFSLSFHEAAAIDWETSFRLAITFGILFSVIEARKRNSIDKRNKN